MVGLEQARAGLTHGVPGLSRSDVELVVPPPSANDDDEESWVRARVPSDLLFELIHTPSYPTWQGEWWLFCCGAPMIYTGSWEPAAFAEHTAKAAGRDWRAAFAQIMEVDDELAAGLVRGDFESAAIYGFRCPRCAKQRAHFDFA
jgi:uncharacterized protein CbrC (UPF0167 family)